MTKLRLENLHLREIGGIKAGTQKKTVPIFTKSGSTPCPLESPYLRPKTQTGLISFFWDEKIPQKRLNLDHGLNFGLPRGGGRCCLGEMCQFFKT